MVVAQCQMRKFSAISWQEQVIYQRDDDEVHYVLDNTLNWIFIMHVAVTPIGHIVLIPKK